MTSKTRNLCRELKLNSMKIIMISAVVLMLNSYSKNGAKEYTVKELGTDKLYEYKDTTASAYYVIGDTILCKFEVKK